MHLSHRLLRLRLRGNGFGTSRKFPRKWPAKTLYELLGVRPDDDAKTLHSAFRDAAKAHHPDLHPSDPHATWRFTQIATAYEILRNTEQRDAYDEMLALERERRRARLGRIIVVVSDTVAIVALAAVIVGGYTLFAQMSKTSMEATKVVEPAAPTDTGLRGEPSGKSTRVELADAPIAPSAAALDKKSHEPLIMAQGDPVPDPAGSDGEVAKAVDALVAAVNRGDMGSGADQHKRNDESHSLDQTRVASAEPQSSSSEKDKSPSSDLAIPDEKHDVRTSAKLRAHAKRPATDRTFVRQAAVESRDMSRAALESRNTTSCASSCSDRAPPLFGLGF
jgi:curved DNA-binding protein CbpA